MKSNRMIPAVTLAALALVSAPAVLAQGSGQARPAGPDLDDRRFIQIFMYDAAVVENTWIEGQFRLQDDASPIAAGDGADTLRIGPVVAFSPLDKLEIGGRIDFLDVDYDGGSESGLSDTTLYGKWQFFHNPVQFAVGLELSLPTGDEDDGLGTGEFDFAFFGSVRKNLEEAYLTGHFGFRNNGDVDLPGPADLEGKTSIFLGGGVMFPMSDRWALSGELEVETERYDERGADSLVEITGGGYWYISEAMTLRGGIGLGLDDGAPDWELIVGMAWHF